MPHESMHCETSNYEFFVEEQSPPGTSPYVPLPYGLLSYPTTLSCPKFSGKQFLHCTDKCAATVAKEPWKLCSCDC